jgi:hypothetical protein
MFALKCTFVVKISSPRNLNVKILPGFCNIWVEHVANLRSPARGVGFQQACQKAKCDYKMFHKLRLIDFVFQFQLVNSSFQQNNLRMKTWIFKKIAGSK